MLSGLELCAGRLGLLKRQVTAGSTCRETTMDNSRMEHEGKQIMNQARCCDQSLSGGGLVLPCLNIHVRLLVAGEDTGGRFALLESVENAGCSHPLHVHSREHELVYVLEGRVRFSLEGQQIDSQAGQYVMLPKGHEHSYFIESERARLLTALAPAGLEGFYRELSQPPDETCGYQDAERLVVVAARYGVAITGPPPILRP